MSTQIVRDDGSIWESDKNFEDEVEFDDTLIAEYDKNNVKDLI